MQRHSTRRDVAYLRQLVGAGLDGIASARHEMRAGAFSPPLGTIALTPTAVGAAIGILSTRLIGDTKSAGRMALGGLIGSVAGFGAAAAWASRSYSGCAARSAIRLMSAARDAHWLETHPIDYA